MQNSSTKVIIPVVLLLLILGAAAFVLLNNKNSTTNNTTSTVDTSMLSQDIPVSAPVSSPVDSTQASISIDNMSFISDSITISKGSTVTWTNNDSTIHTVVADDGEFQSSTLANGDTFSFTFNQAGTYTYHCGIHSSMTGTITVQ